MLVDSEPVSTKEALRKKMWLKAMKEELEAIERNRTWELTKLPKDKKSISVRWVYKVKLKPDGSIGKHKASLVARGFLQKIVLCYFEVFAPIARHETIRLATAIIANLNWTLMHLDVKSAFLNRVEIVYSDKGIILHQLKYKLELLKRFELTNCKSTITPAEANHKLDSNVEDENVNATTFKQLVGSFRYLYNTRPDICYAVGVTLIGVETELTEEIKVRKSVKLMIDNKSTISLAKNPVLHGRSKHIGTEFHFLRNQIQNGVLEVVHYSTQKWVYKVKLNSDRSIVKHKARLVARGILQNSRLDYFEVFALIARNETIRRVIITVANRNWPLMHLDVKYAFLNGPLQWEVYVSQPPGFVKKNHEGMLKYELKFLKKFELTNCKSVITPVETNHKLDSDVEGDDVDVITFKQLVGSLGYLCNTGPDIYYAVGADLKIKVRKPVKLMIDNKSAISLAKNPVIHGRSKHIDTKFHFLRNQVQNKVLEVVHCSTQKQLTDVLTKAIKIEYFI
ncbi:uncharacterized protein LOC127122125 [Lathyrus oleraceus]|uniref:uncharacterized protein LOC127122125 n=1 Tax=Pisum sativum TaxID=3888 RepID=UPI0021CF6706|nr:uncharacterized protein LOC127122125 [Pisum sativum]